MISIKILWGIWDVVLLCCAVCYSGPKGEPLPNCQRYLSTYSTPEHNSDNCSMLELWNQAMPVLRNTGKWSREFVLIMESGSVVWFHVACTGWFSYYEAGCCYNFPSFATQCAAWWHQMFWSIVCCERATMLLFIWCYTNRRCPIKYAINHDHTLWAWLASKEFGGRSNETLIDLLAN